MNTKSARNTKATAGGDSEPSSDVQKSAYPLPKSIAWGLMWASLLLLIVGTLWAMGSPSGFYVVMGSVACVLVSLPMVLDRRYDMISPWSLVALAVYIGSGIRPIFVALGRDGTRSVDDLFLLGHAPEFFLRPGGLYLLGLALMTLGYLTGARRKYRAPVGDRYEFNRTANVVILLCALIGLVGFVLYANSSGGFSLSRISAKRSTIEGLDVGAEYSSNGQYRLINTFAAVAFWAQVAYYSARPNHNSLLSHRGLYLALLFVNASMLPLYASTRSDIVYLVIIAIVIKLALSNGVFARRLVLGGLAFVLVVTPVLTSLRTAATGVSQSDTSRTALLLDTFIYSRTFTDVPTSALIIDAVPESLQFAKGSTIGAWIAAPVPRRMWPGKPLISSGPVIGINVFGNVRSGVPPGLIAESYWNFGQFGLLTMPLAFGFALRRIESWTQPAGRGNPGTVLIFSTCVVKLGVDATTNSLGYALFTATQTFGLLTVFLLLAGSFSGYRNRS